MNGDRSISRGLLVVARCGEVSSLRPLHKPCLDCWADAMSLTRRLHPFLILSRHRTPLSPPLTGSRSTPLRPCFLLPSLFLRLGGAAPLVKAGGAPGRHACSR